MITVKSKHHNYTHTHTQSSKPLILLGRGGVLEPIPAVIGKKAGYTLDRSPVHRISQNNRSCNKGPKMDTLYTDKMGYI